MYVRGVTLGETRKYVRRRPRGSRSFRTGNVSVKIKVGKKRATETTEGQKRTRKIKRGRPPSDSKTSYDFRQFP